MGKTPPSQTSPNGASKLPNNFQVGMMKKKKKRRRKKEKERKIGRSSIYTLEL